jgi:hypothetical protein
MKLTIKQTKAIDYLEDDKITEVYYGGAAGGGKSAIGSFWQLKRRLRYPGSRGMIGRTELKTLKETTLATFFEVAKMQGVIRGVHFDLTTAQDKEFPNCLVFKNGSIIYLKDLFLYPADPDFDELGSLELTDAFIDEASQVNVKAKNIVRSRIRYKLNELNLVPKMLMCGNPSKNWPYFEFYRPSKENNLRGDRVFIPALPGDNPNLPGSYVESLKGLDNNSRERLLYGNWEYDDDPAMLINYDKILDSFTNTHLPRGEKFITADIARFGSDKTVIGIWEGFRVKLHAYRGLNIQEVADKIRIFKERWGVGTSNIIADEDGVGGGVVDILGCKGFVNNSVPIITPDTKAVVSGTGILKAENFINLKSQCYFRLADRINRGGVFIECEEDQKQGIIEELENVKQHNMDKDGKRAVLPKDKLKEVLGRSPDFADTLMMREYFELAPRFSVSVA